MAFCGQVLVAGLTVVLAIGCGSTEDPRVSGTKVSDGPKVTVPVLLGDGKGTTTGMVATSDGLWAGGVDSHGQGSAWYVDRSMKEAVRTVRVPDVQGVAASAGAVWAVGSARRQGPQRDVLFRIVPDDGEVVARISLGSRPDRPRAAVQRVAAGPSGVWVAVRYSRRAGDILRIDPDTNDVMARIDARGVPGDIALGNDAVWFLSDPRPGIGGVSLHRIDPSTNEIVATPVREKLHDVGGSEMLPSFAVGQDDVWVSLFAGGRQQALRVDTHTNEVTVEQLGLRHFSPVAVTDDSVWFIGRGGLVRLETETLEADQLLDLPIAPTDASFDPATGSLWIVGYDPEVVRIGLPGRFGPTEP